MSKYYDYDLIYDRLQAMLAARKDGDVKSLINLLRSGLVRNLGNITAPKLFNRAYAGTKSIIDQYIAEVTTAIQHLSTVPIDLTNESGFTPKANVKFFHDSRQAFGRSTLLLQGGAVFAICH